LAVSAISTVKVRSFALRLIIKETSVAEKNVGKVFR
jgi:hypothetical protein